MTASDELVNTAVAERARRWLLANDEGPLAAQESAAFLAWLRASPVHVKAFLAVSCIAHDLKAAGDEPAFSLEALIEEARRDDSDRVVDLEPAIPRAATGARQPGRWQIWWVAAAAALATLIVATSIVWWSRDGERFGLPRTYQTARGEQTAWRLPDGSVLHLDTDSSVTVHYSKAERVVELNRGQALFEVASGERRRFRVSAGLAQVVALGTEFDVYRRRDATVVTVVEGTVSVWAGEPAPPENATAAPTPSQQVSAGQQIGISGGKLWPAPIPVDAKATVAWLQHQIVVEDRPLGEIAEEINRYGRMSIAIGDPALQALRVSGRFDVYDADSFAAFLAALDGVTIERTASRIRVLRRGTDEGKPAPSAR